MLNSPLLVLDCFPRRSFTPRIVTRPRAGVRVSGRPSGDRHRGAAAGRRYGEGGIGKMQGVEGGRVRGTRSGRFGRTAGTGMAGSRSPGKGEKGEKKGEGKKGKGEKPPL